MVDTYAYAGVVLLTYLYKRRQAVLNFLQLLGILLIGVLELLNVRAGST